VKQRSRMAKAEAVLARAERRRARSSS
jgi:hypothetical protein